MKTTNCKIHGAGVRALSSGDRARCSACNVSAVIKRRRKLKLMAVEYKGGCCSRCGYSKSVAALDFHHRDPSKKDFQISKRGYCLSWDRMKVELDKCDLVCRNCHAEIHEIEHGSQIVTLSVPLARES